jgi:glucose-1-phosphate adenylyltransferase
MRRVPSGFAARNHAGKVVAAVVPTAESANKALAAASASTTKKVARRRRRWVIGEVATQNHPHRASSLPNPSMSAPALPPGTTQRTLAIVMGGGAGTRLFPLTKDRAKPAVPLGGKYRIVDIPISNCLNSGLRSIYVLTQFNSMSLHRHIQASYKFDNFSRSFVEILAAQQTPEGSQWYQGTADAVRQNMRYFLEGPFDYYLILGGDQLYRMDFRALLHQHIQSGADITLATKPVHRHQVSELGIMQSGVDLRIVRFVEKPKDEAVLQEMKMSRELLVAAGENDSEELFQASMGIYVFNRDVLVKCLDNELADFGKHVIPQSIKDQHVHAYIFQGYWEDVGTIRSFYEANLDLTNIIPDYSFFEAESPIYTHPRFLPGSKINGATLRQAIISDGCIISDAHLERSVIGVRSIIQSGATIRNSIIMGADYFEQDKQGDSARPPIGIGRNCVIDRAIIDKNARIADGVVVTPEGKPQNLDAENYFIRDGIVIVPKNAVIPAGFWI